MCTLPGASEGSNCASCFSQGSSIVQVQAVDGDTGVDNAVSYDIIRGQCSLNSVNVSFSSPIYNLTIFKPDGFLLLRRKTRAVSLVGGGGGGGGGNNSI